MFKSFTTFLFYYYKLKKSISYLILTWYISIFKLGYYFIIKIMVKLSSDFIDPEAVTLLSASKIFTVNDFLDADIEKLALCSKLSVERILILKNDLINKFFSSLTNASKLYGNASKEIFIRTHIQGLDTLLSGGVPKGAILELCGLSGCGKTRLCHTIAVNCAVDSVSVDFIDTKQDFSASYCNNLLPTGLKDEEMDAILENINVYHTTNIYELISALTKIQSNLQRSINGQNKILIIDSITVPYLPFVGISASKGFSILNFIASILKQVATEFNIAVILTNLGIIYNDNDVEPMSQNSHEVKPLMGKYWQHIPNTRIIIMRDPKSTKRGRLLIHKSDYLSVNRTEIITLSEAGES